MSHTVWFDVPLTCCSCKREIAGRKSGMYTSDLLLDAADRYAEPGDLLEIEWMDFADAYRQLREPAKPDVTALEQWPCPECGSVQWAKITFRQEAQDCFRLIGAECAPLNEQVLAQVDYVSRKLEDWLRDNPGPGADRLAQTLDSLKEC